MEPNITENPQAAFLRSSEQFSAVYQSVTSRLSNTQSSLTERIPVEKLRGREGMLVVDSIDAIRPVYEAIEAADHLYKDMYDEGIETLVHMVRESEELASAFKSDDDISIAIEDLFEEDRVSFEAVMEDISSRMPIKTLWAKVERESAQWLESQADVESPNWAEHPEEQCAIAPINRLFVNEDRFIMTPEGARLMGESATAEEGDAMERACPQCDRSAGEGDAMSHARTGPGRHDGCRTFRMRQAWANNGTSNGSTRLCVRIYVNNFLIWKSFGVSCKGWRRIRGRWRARRFEKTLTRGGTMLVHHMLFGFCNPAFAQSVNWTRVRRHRSFAINSTLWGMGIYVGAPIGGFWGVVRGNGVSAQVVMT